MPVIKDTRVGIRFGENLKRHRRLMRLSQEELALRASLHRTEIGLLEHGQRVPRIDTLIKLSSSLSINPAELLEGIHWVPVFNDPGAYAFNTQLEILRGDGSESQ